MLNILDNCCYHMIVLTSNTKADCIHPSLIGVVIVDSRRKGYKKIRFNTNMRILESEMMNIMNMAVAR